MMNIMSPCKVVNTQKSHSMIRAAVLSPTTKKPRAHVIPRTGTRTNEAWRRVLEGGVGREEHQDT